MKRFFCLLFCLFFLLPFSVSANLGVGVGTGKIVIDEALKPGTIYDISPTFSILNTGDEEAVYKIGISYLKDQKEYEPPKEWFEFSENNFHLKPGEVKNIKVKLNIPIKTVPGDYFCYLEGSLAPKSGQGQSSVGIAAGAKLYFKIAPANIFEAVFYRALSLWKQYLPWTNIVLGTLVIFILINLVKSKINIQIGIKKKEKNNNTQEENAE